MKDAKENAGCNCSIVFALLALGLLVVGWLYMVGQVIYETYRFFQGPHVSATIIETLEGLGLCCGVILVPIVLSSIKEHLWPSRAGGDDDYYY